MRHVFGNYTGCLEIGLWNGETIRLGVGTPEVAVIFNSPAAFRNLILRRDILHLAQSYFFGDIDVNGDFHALFAQRDHLAKLKPSLRDRFNLLLDAIFLSQGANDQGVAATHATSTPRQSRSIKPRHSRTRDREAIAFHYDVSNDFYALWLDRRMVYSCAYFKEAIDTIDQAQANKLEHICRKLRLQPGERLLDVGCGWGALICWAAEHYRVKAHGITLSEEQHNYATKKIHSLGLQDRVTVELRDYRDLNAGIKFDKAASVGMFEHVGIKNFPAYFDAVRRVLKPGGLFLNHGITNDEEGWKETLGTRFIQKYIFPDGELDTISNVQRAMEKAGFEIWDVEALRPHYILTLQQWLSRLEQNHSEALSYVTEEIYRTWRLYLAGCAAQFERGSIGVYQVLAVNGRDRLHDIPLTRSDIYR